MAKYHCSKKFATDTIRTAPNFLLALGLSCYTEYWGKLLLGTEKKKRREPSKAPFLAFLKSLDVDVALQTYFLKSYQKYLPISICTTTDGPPLWESVGSPPGGADGSPATTTWGTNRLDVFVKSGNGQIYHRWYDPNNLPPGWSTAAGTSAEPY